MSASPPPGPSRVPLSELKRCKFIVQRADVTTICNSPGPIDRANMTTTRNSSGPIMKMIEDPKQIVNIVHQIRDDGVRNSNTLFTRGGVLVNQYKISMLDEDYNVLEQRKSKGNSESESPENSCASSSYERTSDSRKSRNLVKEVRIRIGPDCKRKVNLHEESGRLSRSSSLDEGNRRNFDGSIEKMRDQRRYADRPYSRELKRESSRRRSMTPLRPGEYRPYHYDTRRRTRSRSRKYSRSKHRRSRSHSQKRRKSQSPRYSKSSTSSTSRKPSRSPGSYSLERSRRDKYRSRYQRDRSRSRSPTNYPKMSKRRSSSGGHNRRSEHRRSGRSPDYKSRSEKYRSRSPTPNKHRRRSPHHHGEPKFTFYEGIPVTKCWIPAPVRQSFPGMHRFYPPSFFPRIPSAPIIVPPRFPIYPPFAHRLPVYNSRPKHKTPTHGQSSNNNSSTDGTRVTTAGSNKDGDTTIQET